MTRLGLVGAGGVGHAFFDVVRGMEGVSVEAICDVSVDRLRQVPIGYYYDVVTNGFGAMSDYAAQVAPEDRWAIAAYIRTLQYSQYAPAADVPAEKRAQLEASLAPAPPASPEHHR